MCYKKFYPVGDYNIFLKIQRGDSPHYLVFKITEQRIQAQKVQIRRDKFHTLNDFKNLLGDIN